MCCFTMCKSRLDGGGGGGGGERGRGVNLHQRKRKGKMQNDKTNRGNQKQIYL